MSYLFNNATAIAVAVVAAILVWAFGGTRGDLLPGLVPWLSAFMVEIALCFPQRHRGESTYEARERAWSAIRKDPITWIAVGLLALLAIPFVNNGLCQLCDCRAIAQGVNAKPPVPILPFCVSRLDHLNVFLWFLVVLPALIAVKHCLLDGGKRLVLELIMWNGVAIAALGFIQNAMGAPGPLWNTHCGTRWGPGVFFATFGYPNMAGDYFTTLFAVAVALWREHLHLLREQEPENSSIDRERNRQFWRRHYFLIPAVVFFFAAVNTLSRAAIVLVSLSAVVFFLHALVTVLARLHRARRVTVGVWSSLVFGVVVFFAVLFMPAKVQKEVDTLGTTAMLDRVTGRGQYHGTVATAIWKDHALFGCGGWGYLHLCTPKMKELRISTKNVQEIGGINVHNDYLQFLAEHGLVGLGALVALAVLLIWPVGREWKRLARNLRFATEKKLPPKPRQIFVLPAPAFVLLFGELATLIHAFGDCPFRTPVILMLFFVILAALPGFLPDMPDPETRHRRH